MWLRSVTHCFVETKEAKQSRRTSISPVGLGAVVVARQQGGCHGMYSITVMCSQATQHIDEFAKSRSEIDSEEDQSILHLSSFANLFSNSKLGLDSEKNYLYSNIDFATYLLSQTLTFSEMAVRESLSHAWSPKFHSI